jgi:hypothetical protein
MTSSASAAVPIRWTTPSAVVSALPDFALAGVCLVTWIRPEAFGERMAGWILLMMLVEFIVIHSAAFMGVVIFSESRRAKKVLHILGLALFYSAFAGAFAAAFDSMWPLLTFWGLTLNRLVQALITDVTRQEARNLAQASWGGNALFYLLFAFVTSFVPLPKLGIDAAAAAALGFEGSGLWVDEPHRVVAFGFLYFAAVGYSELRAEAWMKRLWMK